MKTILLIYWVMICSLALSAKDENALIMIIIKNDLDAAQELLSSSGDININSSSNSVSSPPLLMSRDEKMTKLLLKYGADVEVKGDVQNMSALMEASRNGNIEQAMLLINAGSNVNHKDDLGRTALHYAAGNLNANLAVYLLKNGAYVDAQDYEGNSALMRATQKGDYDLVKVLLNAGANWRLFNKDKKRAEDMIQFLSDDEIRSVMRDIFIKNLRGSQNEPRANQ